MFPHPCPELLWDHRVPLVSELRAVPLAFREHPTEHPPGECSVAVTPVCFGAGLPSQSPSWESCCFLLHRLAAPLALTLLPWCPAPRVQEQEGIPVPSLLSWCVGFCRRSLSTVPLLPSPGSPAIPIPPFPWPSRNVMSWGELPQGAEHCLIVSGCTAEAIRYLILYEPHLPSSEQILLPLQSQIHLSAQPSDSFTWKLFL